MSNGRKRRPGKRLNATKKKKKKRLERRRVARFDRMPEEGKNDEAVSLFREPASAAGFGFSRKAVDEQTRRQTSCRACESKTRVELNKENTKKLVFHLVSETITSPTPSPVATSPGEKCENSPFGN